MAKATLINKEGKKVVVEGGSQQAKDYFGQGYQLMGAGGQYAPPAATTTTVTPEERAAQAVESVKSLGTSGQLATMINPKTGKRVAVPVNSEESKGLSAAGYVLEGATQGKPAGVPITPTPEAYKPSTFINPTTGDRVKVTSKEQENDLYTKGYALEGTTIGKPAVEKLTDFNGATTRAGIEALGGTYIGTLEGKDKAIREGKDVIFVNGSYYIRPKTGVQTTEQARQQTTEQTTTTETEKPALPNLRQTYEDLRKSQGLEGLNDQMNKAKSDLQAFDDNYVAGQHKVSNEFAPMEIIGGRAEKLQQQYQEARVIKMREIEDLQNQITTKTEMVNNLMTLTEKDYTYAKDAYDTSFTQNLQMQQFYAQQSEAEYTKENAARDDARANLNTLIGAIKDSGKGWSDVSASMKSQIQQLEIKAGIPPGSMETFVASKPKANILATVNGTDASGNDIVSFVYADENGNPGVVTTLKTGGYTAPKTTTTTSTSDLNSYASMIMAGRMNASDVSQDDRLAVTQILDQLKSTPIGKEISSFISKLAAGTDPGTRETLITDILSKYYTTAEQSDQAVKDKVAETVYNFIPDEIETGYREKIKNKGNTTTITLPNGQTITL